MSKTINSGHPRPLVQVLTSSSNWKWPDVEGVHDFKGDLVHTASWPEGYDLTNKTVALIGNGASGIQLLPAIQPGESSVPGPSKQHLLMMDIDVKKLYHVVRTPTWIPPPWRQGQAMMGGGQMLKEISLDAKENFTPEQIQRFEDDSEFYRRFVKGIEKDTSGNFRAVSHACFQVVKLSMLTVSLPYRWSETAPFKRSPAPRSGST